MTTIHKSFHRNEYIRDAFAGYEARAQSAAANVLLRSSKRPQSGRKMLTASAGVEWIPLAKELEVEGQGSVGFQLNADGPVKFRFAPESGDSLPLVFSVEAGGMGIFYEGEKTPIAYTTEQGVDVGRKQTYWISINKNLSTIKCGTGYVINALTQLEYTAADGDTKFEGMIDNLKTIASSGVNPRDTKMELVYWKYPVTVDLPPLVVANSEITLANLDTDNKTVVQNLSDECQKLFANVAGSNIQLNTPDFPDFSEAIDYSIRTKGCVCYNMLKSKVSEFSGEGAPKNDANETYLRVTLGTNKGDSPGVPYVMEIWPGGHYSPVHNHSNANAVIKVLHGSLTTFWFKSLEKEDDVPYTSAQCKSGDVTWLSDRQFQTHRLFNHNVGNNNEPGPPCVTVQCYMYNDEDDQHYEYFDYLDDVTKETKQFEPNSDWDYLEFKQLLFAEYSAYKKVAQPQPCWVDGDGNPIPVAPPQAKRTLGAPAGSRCKRRRAN